MTELNRGYGFLRCNEIDHALHLIALLVIPQAEAVMGDAAARLGVYRLGEYDAGAPGGPGGEMGEMPVIHETIGSRVLAHWRKHDPVLDGDGSDCERPEQVRIGVAAENSTRVLAGRHLENTCSQAISVPFQNLFIVLFV
jgi:hypothetical protein